MVGIRNGVRLTIGTIMDARPDSADSKFVLAQGAEERGVVIGNVFDKYGSRNPIVRWLMNGFSTTLEDLVAGRSDLEDRDR